LFDTEIIDNIQEVEQILKKLQNYFPCEKVNNKNRFVHQIMFMFYKSNTEVK